MATEVSQLLDTVHESEASMKELSKSLETLADEFDERQRKMDIAKVSLSSTGLAGGIMTVVGLALAPVTFGASLGLTIAGGVIGGGSAIGNISTLIADKIISKKSLEEAQRQLNDFAEKSKELQTKLGKLMGILNVRERVVAQDEIEKCPHLSKEMKKQLIEMLRDSQALRVGIQTRFVLKPVAMEAFKQIIEAAKLLSKAGKAGQALKGVATGAEAAAGAANVGKSVGTAADVGTDAAATTGKVAASGVKVAGIAMAGVGIAIDLGALIYYSHKIRKNKPSDLAAKIRTVAECLK